MLKNMFFENKFGIICVNGISSFNHLLQNNEGFQIKVSLLPFL